MSSDIKTASGEVVDECISQLAITDEEVERVPIHHGLRRFTREVQHTRVDEGGKGLKIPVRDGAPPTEDGRKSVELRFQEGRERLREQPAGP